MRCQKLIEIDRLLRHADESTLEFGCYIFAPDRQHLGQPEGLGRLIFPNRQG